MLARAIAVTRDDPEPLADRAAVPTELAALVHRCLARDPTNRPPSAADLADRLRRLAGDLATSPGASTSLSMRPEAPPLLPSITPTAATSTIDVATADPNAPMPITSLPITGTEPDHADKILLVPGALGLSRRSWIVTSEINVSDWPGHDLRPAKTAIGAYWRYGRLSDGLRARLAEAVSVLIRTGQARLSTRA